MKSIRTMLKGLTPEDLLDWAGGEIFNRGEEYVDCVSQLSCTGDGTLVAWVSGSDEYATSVRRDEQGDFVFDCTCPYDDVGPCKHVVAVLLATAEQLKRHQEIPLLDPEDDLYLEMFDDLEEDTDGADHENDEDDDLDLEDSPRKPHHF